MLSSYTVAQYKPYVDNCNESKVENIFKRNFHSYPRCHVIVNSLIYVKQMEISYNKTWKLLTDKNMKRKDLQNLVGISSTSIAKFGYSGLYALRYHGNYKILMEVLHETTLFKYAAAWM